MLGLGPYEPLRKLGEGGMGVVYLAEAPDGRLVAVKVIRPEVIRQEGFRRRFLREAEAARRVPRSCTAQLLDACLDGEVAYLVTEYVDGPTLAQAVAEEGPLRGAQLEALALGVATALRAIHSAGVVHRDLKPSNVLLTRFVPRVIDFGVSRLTDTGASVSGAVVGTPAFMAPEQVSGAPAGPAADVFAWGGLVAYAASGRPPFGTGGVAEVLYRVAHREPDLDGLSGPLRGLVARAMAKEPAHRPTAAQLLDALTTTASRRAPRRPWLWGAAAGAVVVALLAVLVRHGDPVVYREDFAGAAPGWQADSGSEVRDGRYVISPQAGQWLVRAAPYGASGLARMRVGADVRVESGPGGFGLYCFAGKNTGYQFVVDATRTAIIRWPGGVIAARPFKPVAGARVEASCVASAARVSLALTVGGRAEVSAVDRTPLPPGGCGIYANAPDDGAAVVSFDAVEITRLD
ncbi:serine/threonine protein kinase [Streptosporangiaceae bacterium NEAU-GS5]|nr:serine/threonine protein kinase [Streptosporangiaceae bacterium NEAU-GS5]